MIKNIIFDFDGVLVDSEILVAKAFSKYMQELGIKTNEKEFANLAGKKTVEVIDILSEKYSLKDKQKFFDDIMNIASNIYKKELKTVVGVEEFLGKSKHGGIKLWLLQLLKIQILFYLLYLFLILHKLIKVQQKTHELNRLFDDS